jgi:hypothetical protein
MDEQQWPKEADAANPPTPPPRSSNQSGMALDEAAEDDPEEVKHYNEVIASMRHYYVYFRRTMLDRMHRHHAKLSDAHVAMLPDGAEGITRKLDR